MYIYLITNSLTRYCNNNKITQEKHYGAGAGYCNNDNNNNNHQVLAPFILLVVADDGSDSVGVQLTTL